jgi:ribosome-associated translation inhibitor RaiA
MNVRYISRDIDWTESMKIQVENKIIAPVRRFLNSERFDLSVCFDMERRRSHHRFPDYELWVVLQTFDGRSNEVVRCQGSEFLELINEVSNSLKEQLRKSQVGRRFSMPAFWLSPFEGML